MFSLVISVISVVLVAGLILASLYYGGDAFFAAGDKAKASKLTSEAEQLRTAIQMYEIDNGQLPGTLEDLTNGNYLQNVPSEWANQSQYFTKSNYDVTSDVCLQFNTSRGIPFVPECTDEVYQGMTVCCRNTLMSQ